MIAEALPKKDVTKMEKHVFRVYDTNKDGYIDFVEFMVVFHILSGERDVQFYSLLLFSDIPQCIKSIQSIKEVYR